MVFPGLGQIMLKHYKRGIAFMLPVLFCLAVIIVKAAQQAFAILEKIESEGRAINMVTISKAATHVSAISDGLILNIAFLLTIFFWIIGVFDAYKIGKKKDREEQSENGIIWP